ncbi:MAG TPA: cell surface protein SprA [Bacteroidia bacterium]|nr:cell surface protein SprA [Bacteroidia bacterium]
MQLKKLVQFTLSAALVVPVFSIVWGTKPAEFSGYSDLSGTPTIPVPVDTPLTDSLKYPFHDRYSDPYSSQYNNTPLYLDDPENIKTTIEYNPDEKQYDINERMGDMFYRDPTYMTFEEFKEAQFKNSTKKYWEQRSSENDILQRKGFNPKIYIGSDVFDRIFGGNTIDIRPQGSASLKFGLKIQHSENPAVPVKQRTNTSFEFNEQIQMNVIGNIGEKMKLGVNYNTEAGFDFENKMKLEYTGKEDEIIQKIEAGNITLPLTGSLIQGTQTLFGIKTALKFGRMNVTTVFSQQKGQRSTINVPPGGGQITNYEILADQYEANKHFFLAQYFKDNYDKALKNLPVINSPINITKIEVWKTNRTAASEANRDVVAFMDLGEYNYFSLNLISQGTSVYPSDSLSNNLYKLMTTTYKGIRSGDNAASILSGLSSAPTNFDAQQDYVVIRNAKKLESTEYVFNPRLGYISLNSALNPDEAIAVAFEYTIGNTVYRVGELSTSGVEPPNTLILKLIRSKSQIPELPTWDLMMKNIYSLNGYQIQKENFKLDVLYADDADGGKKKRYISAGATESFINGNPLIKIFGLDTLNSNGDAGGDGVFDFVEGITINTQNGRIIFPEREPFGSYLKSKFNDQTPAGPSSKYIYQELYDSTLTVAQQFAIKNKFSIAGSYQSASGAEISLNAINIPQGSVTVTAGGVPLTENTDFTVDYNLGRVKIINAGILASNTPIQVSVESQSLFSIQSKTLLGARFDYAISKDFTVGGTYLHLNERPITQKVNIGDEPISNTIWGVDGTYRTDSRFITKWVDKLPFLATKEKSTVTVSGEFAQLIPGHSSAIGSGGNAYIDDFEGSQSTIDIRNANTWFLASTPQGIPGRFEETQGMFIDSLRYGFNRAKFAWYTIDPSVFYRANASLLPPNISNAELSNNNVRAVLENEIFPNKENPNNVQTELSVLNLAFYPGERGPYNYDVEPTSISAGISPTTGELLNHKSRWGGIMRRIETSDFESSNVQFIQFWIMDPKNNESLDKDGGKLYFDLGNISEDILSDGQQFFENGLPAATNNFSVDTSSWGLFPTTEYLLNAFDNDPASRKLQDVGLDGLSTTQEQSFFQQSFLDRLNAFGASTAVIDTAQRDPSSDDFHYFRGSDFDNLSLGVLDRYKKYNGTEGNSNSDTPEGYSISATTIPDNEDINRDFQTDQDESYNEYEIDFSLPSSSWKYVVDSTSNPAQTPDGLGRTVKWYQFKIPINDPDAILINHGANLKSVNFVRMYMREWENPVILRFGKLEFLRGEWRRYGFPIDLQDQSISLDLQAFDFDVTVVNLEENGKRSPIPYVIPPGIEREINVGTTNNQQLNEQSLAIKVCNMPDGESRAAYKSTQFDVRNYKNIKMFIHAEEWGCGQCATTTRDNDAVVFVRLGTDFSANYYEYNIPLKLTTPGTTSAEGIWPTANELDIEIAALVNYKLARDKKVNFNTTLYSIPDTVIDGNGRLIRVVGNPSLSNVKSIMIGIKNPDATFFNPYSPDDDGQPKCVEIWVNELRMTNFNEKGGWAATARVQAKLADLGNVTISGAKSTYGFGPLESKINERQQDNREQYDIASSLELGKFFPQKIGLSIPFYIGYSKAIANPYYNPLDPDVRFNDALDNLPDDAQRNELKKITQDYTRRNSYNFTNVRKNKTGNATKSHVYDIENFNFTYGYSEIYRRNVNTEYDLQKDYLAAIGYNYFSTAKGFSPFAKSKGFKSKYAKPIKDFNINFIPSNFSFRTDVNRHYGELKLRNINDDQFAPPPTYDKRFLMSRQYALTWDLTKSLKFDFDANNIARIDEPPGRLDTPAKRDSMWSNFWRGGRNTDYHHSGNLSYNVPLNKLPITDWVSVNTRYGFDYHWTASSLIYDPVSLAPRINPALGNTIQNSNSKQVNGTFTFSSLYNKVPLFKKLLSPPKPKPKAQPKPKVDENAPKDSATVKKPPVPKEKEYGAVVRGIAKVFLSIKNFTLNYTETKGTLLPGYIRTSELLGQDLYSGGPAPGWGFVFGQQDSLFKYRAANNRWITRDSTMNNQFTNTLTRNLTLRSTIEPASGLRIELNAMRSRAQNHSEYFRYFKTLTGEEGFNSFSSIDAGNFSISWLTINTAFTKDNKDYTSDVFNKFNENRRIISKRLAEQNSLSNGFDSTDVYRDGFGATSQQVLTFAFLSAYSGKDANKISLNPFPSTPLPNWRITYDGLSKLAFAKKLFQNVSLTHGYRSSYSINTYATSLLFKQDGSARDQVNNFISRYEFGQISITEEFSPLLGIDIGWKVNKNTLSTRVEFKRDRNLSLDFAGIQLTEIKGTELTIGAGYRFKPKFKLKIAGKQQSMNNDLNITADVSFRKNTTILRKLQEQIDQPTAGLKSYSFDIGADYAVSERFNIKAYFKRDGTTPLISTSFPNTSTEFGFILRFTLAQ